MNKVQFFADADVTALQDSVNQWLAEHPQIEVLQSDLSSIVKPDLLGNIQGIEKYVFYILYTDAKLRKRRQGLTMQETIPAANIANIPTIDMPPPPSQASVANKAKTG